MAKTVKLRVSPTAGNPTVPMNGDFDIRDRLAELVGKGNALSPDDKSAIYGSLASAYGNDKAQKIMTHAFIFNQRPDVAKLPLEEKIKAFYTIGSNDPDVNAVIAKSKTLGYGPVPGFRQSSSAINQQLSGQVPASTVPVTTTLNPEAQKKIMLRVNK